MPENAWKLDNTGLGIWPKKKKLHLIIQEIKHAKDNKIRLIYNIRGKPYTKSKGEHLKHAFNHDLQIDIHDQYWSKVKRGK